MNEPAMRLDPVDRVGVRRVICSPPYPVQSAEPCQPGYFAAAVTLIQELSSQPDVVHGLKPPWIRRLRRAIQKSVDGVTARSAVCGNQRYLYHPLRTTRD